MITTNTTPPALVMCRAELEALLAFSSQDHNRPHLYGVTLRANGAFATDGAIMLAGPFAEPLSIKGDVVVEWYALDRLIRAVPKEGGVRFLFNESTMENDEIEIIVANGLAHPGAWEAAKPFLWALVPMTRDVSPVPFEAIMERKAKGYPKSCPGFDGSLLAKIDPVTRAAFASGKSLTDSRVRFHPGDAKEANPLHLEWHGFGQRWTACIMPVKD